MADGIMRAAASGAPQRLTAPRFAIIDIDDATWIDWDSPLVTPRNRLADLIDHVARSSPALIIVDVDLAFPGGGGESRLQSLLETYGKSVSGEVPPLILVRSLKPTNRAIDITPRETGGISVEETTNVHWALPSFLRDEDGIVRRWQLATLVCAGDAPVIVPSVQLLAAWLFLGRSGDDLARALQPLRSPNCDSPASDANIRLGLGSETGMLPAMRAEKTIEINTSDLSSRIMYTIGWQADQPAFGPRVGDSYKIISRSAKTVLKLDEGDSIPGIGGRIALIGGTFRDSGDWYRTPLGDMPGVMILINATDALIQHGTLKEPSTPLQLALALTFILVVALCVGWLRAPVSSAASLIAIGVITAASVPLFRSGILFSVAIPALVIVLVDIVLTLLEDIDTMRRLGWRWIFRHVRPSEPHEEIKR